MKTRRQNKCRCVIYELGTYIVLLNSEQHAQKKFETFSFVLDKTITDKHGNKYALSTFYGKLSRLNLAFRSK